MPPGKGYGGMGKAKKKTAAKKTTAGSKPRKKR